MKMVLILDKICLTGAIGLSLYAGYKLGRKAEKLDREINETIKKTNFNVD